MAKKSDAVRIAEIQAQSQLLRDLFGNPVLSYVMAFTLLEVLQQSKVTGRVETGLAEVALGAVAGAQALGPALPDILGVATKALAGGKG